MVRGEKAPSSIEWSRDNVAVSMDTATVTMTTVGTDTTSVLTVDSLETAGSYRCTAQFATPAGQVVSNVADLSILGKDLSLILLCNNCIVSNLASF